ncbi:MAG: ABC transporter substrate-binding protein [Candidatus Vecturithrix sp.]|jgi:ribose transport system substrate-binding protein|nr:ABC transporter substrate-binding protein [Candidatus Vecturithrix sp.]
MRKLFGLLMIMVCIFTLTTGVFAAEKIKIGVSIPSADHGWTGGIVWWAQKAVEEWAQKDAELEFFVVTADSPAKQVGDVEDLMVKGINALVILPHDSAPLTPVVEEVYNSGIYTVVVDRGLTKEAQHVYVAGDNPGLGRVSAEWMAKAMEGKGKIVVLEGIPCVINTERVEAFKAVMAKYPDIEIMDSQPAHWSTQKGLEIMENYLQKYDQIDAVWAQDDDVLKGVLQAYKESGRDDIQFFLGGAGSKDIVKMIIDGDPVVRADVTYPPSMVATAISLAVKGVKNIPLDGFYQMKIPSRVILAAELIISENAQDYYYPDSVF